MVLQLVVFNKNDDHDCTSMGSSAEVDDGELPAVFLSCVFSKAVLDVSSCWVDGVVVSLASFGVAGEDDDGFSVVGVVVDAVLLLLLSADGDVAVVSLVVVVVVVVVVVIVLVVVVSLLVAVVVVMVVGGDC